MVRRSALNTALVVCFAVVVTLLASPLQAQTQRVTGKPTALRVTVAKVELWNGTAWVSLFTGSAQLEMVAGGAFPGIANLNLPAGTYSKLRITVVNSFGATGSLSYSATTYYMTDAAGPGPGTAAASTSAANAKQFNFSNPAWGALGASYVIPEFSITPITVGPTTDYQPTLKFDVTNALELWEAPGPVFYFVLGVPVVSII